MSLGRINFFIFPLNFPSASLERSFPESFLYLPMMSANSAWNEQTHEKRCKYDTTSRNVFRHGVAWLKGVMIKLGCIHTSVFTTTPMYSTTFDELQNCNLTIWIWWQQRCYHLNQIPLTNFFRSRRNKLLTSLHPTSSDSNLFFRLFTVAILSDEVLITSVIKIKLLILIRSCKSPTVELVRIIRPGVSVSPSFSDFWILLA